MGDKASKSARSAQEDPLVRDDRPPGGQEAEVSSSDSDSASTSGDTGTAPRAEGDPADQDPVPEIEKPPEVWDEVCRRLDVPLGSPAPTVDKIQRQRNEWRTVRIFVSSTFKDFYYEREVLIKQIFPELRLWCQERMLRLVDIDLRWGVPEDSSYHNTLKLCLEEIDRCEKENKMPYFINLTSLRAGWVPTKDDVKEELLQNYKCLVYGLSVTEMEIVHGAFKNINPNSLFLLRVLNQDTVNKIPEKLQDSFIEPKKEQKEKNSSKLEELKRRIKSRFEDDQIHVYECTFEDEQYDKFNKPIFHFVPEDIMRSTVMEFFKKRIDHQYPLSDMPVPENEYHKARLAHEAFMKSKADFVLGRNVLIKTISKHLRRGKSNTPMVVYGEAGIGKSAVMAKVVAHVIGKIEQGRTQEVGQKPHVFYHFVGAVPGSTELHGMLARLLLELNVVTEATMPGDLESLVTKTSSILRNEETSPIIIVVDAINQFAGEDQELLLSCVRNKLAPQVRCVVSTIKDSKVYQVLAKHEHRPKMEQVKPLESAAAKDIVTKYLSDYKKQLSDKEMDQLMQIKAISNPLWLMIACEELRVIGVFRYRGSAQNTVYVVQERIKELKELDLFGILGQMLDRFLEDGSEEERNLLRATLCLLEVSFRGLLETELLFLLGDVENLVPPPQRTAADDEKGEGEKSQREHPKFDERVPHRIWVTVQRTLGPFLRPFGDIGEGRLDFYHRSMSKVVRNKYLNSEDETKWWHQKLADYFEQSTDIDRKVEEYPNHLVHLNNKEKLQDFLADWQTVDKLLNNKLSTKLLRYWRQCGTYEDNKNCYENMLRRMKIKMVEAEGGDLLYDELGTRQLQVSRIMLQIEKFDYALSVAEECLKNEEEKLGGRTERLVKIYSLLADIWGEKSKCHKKIGEEQAPDIEKCIEYNTKVIELLRTNETSDSQVQARIGGRQIKLAFALVQLDQVFGTDAKAASGRTCQDECPLIIEQATELFTKLGDNASLVELKMTEAARFWRKAERKKRPKVYSEAWDMCVKFVGKHDLLSARIQHNWAIACNRVDDIKEAYRHFKISYIINQDLYGTDHPETKNTMEILQRERFKGFHDADKLEEEIKSQDSF